MSKAISKLPQLKACLLGGFSLFVDGRPQENVNQPQQQSLLAYLMLQTQTPQLRKHIAFLFWPDSSEKRAYANLRGALHKLRNDCPAVDLYLTSTNTTLGWQRPPTFSLDVLEFERLVAQSRETADRSVLMQAEACYRGELLPGCFDEWLLPERERLNQRYAGLLYRLVDALAAEGEYETAVHYATRLRNADPFSERTYQLLMATYEALGDRAAALRVYHDCAAMLERELGVEPGAETHTVYSRILNRSASTPPGPPPTSSRLTTYKLVGRQEAWYTLQTAWQTAGSGHPTMVLISGEAGIGKTRLAEELLSWAEQQGCLTVHTRAYAAEGQLTYAPVIAWLRSPPYRQALLGLEEVWLSECARLLPELLTARPDLSPPLPLSESWQRQRLFEALARAVLAPSEPLLVLVDDMQWADKETLEWLHFLLRLEPSAPLLVLGTARLSEVDPHHPLTALLEQLHRNDHIQHIPLSPLSAAASDELAQHITQHIAGGVSVETLAELRRYAEGVPLFLVEALRAELDKDESERWRWSSSPLSSPASSPSPPPLPPKVQAVIQARLNRLSPGARGLANLAAVLGRSFSLELLALASRSDEDSLVQDLDELWQRRIVRQQGSDYDLSHDRIRDVAYAELSPVQRQRLHRHAAEALARHHETTLDTVQPQLAHHYEEAGLFAQAVESYLQAGRAAQRVFANARASELLNRGVALLEHLPATLERDQQTLALYVALSASLQVTKGWTSLEMYEATHKAWQLSNTLNDSSQGFRQAKVLFNHHVVVGNLDQGGHVARHLLDVAEREGSGTFFVTAHTDQAFVHMCRGNLELAGGHVEQSFAHYNPRQHRTHPFPGNGDDVFPFTTKAHTLWLLGFPDGALNMAHEGVGLMQRLERPFSQAVGLAYLTMLYGFRRETVKVAEYAETCLAMTTRYDIGYYHHWAEIFWAWTRALAQSAGSDENLYEAALLEALAEFEATGARLRLPFYLSLLAVFYEQAGEVEQGLESIDKAFSAAARHNENWWNAELYRLRGNLLLLRGSADGNGLAAEAYRQAIELAREQKARSLELRAMTSLARLWRTQGRAAGAYSGLAAVYQAFTEGFGTPDLKEAKALLVVLEDESPRPTSHRPTLD